MPNSAPEPMVLKPKWDDTLLSSTTCPISFLLHTRWNLGLLCYQISITLALPGPVPLPTLHFTIHFDPAGLGSDVAFLEKHLYLNEPLLGNLQHNALDTRLSTWLWLDPSLRASFGDRLIIRIVYPAKIQSGSKGPMHVAGWNVCKIKHLRKSSRTHMPPLPPPKESSNMSAN